MCSFMKNHCLKKVISLEPDKFPLKELGIYKRNILETLIVNGK